MDPYLLFDTPRFSHINKRKPAQQTELRLMRAYDVLRTPSAAVILGSSRAAWGLDGDDDSWPAHIRPVYNLALPAGGPEEAYQYLLYVTASRHISTAFLGLEVNYFMEQDPVAVDYHPHQTLAMQTNLRQSERDYFRDVLTFMMSLDALSDSALELLENLHNPSGNISAGGLSSNRTQVISEKTDADAWFGLLDLMSFRWYRGRPGDTRAMQAVREILDLCRSQRIHLVLFMSPSHADELEVIHLTGLWSTFENWKREIVSLVAEYDPRGELFEVWDFSNYDAYSTESIGNGQPAPHWFWDSYHYTHALGDALAERLVGRGDPALGEKLTPENLESHLARVNTARLKYLERSESESRRLQTLAALSH